MTKVYCSTCAVNFTEIATDAVLSPDFRFACKDCLPRDKPVQGLDTSHDPRLGHDPLIGRSGWRPSASLSPQFSDEENHNNEEVDTDSQETETSNWYFIPDGFHLDRKAPKRMKPGPEWSRSDAFLREMLADRTDEEKAKALLVLIGRWRQQETFEEIAAKVGMSEPAVRAVLAELRREGDALWKKKQRAAAKAERSRQLSLRAHELFARDLTVRQVAGILKCSVGLASELRQAS